jgi:hypothetical protein
MRRGSGRDGQGVADDALGDRRYRYGERDCFLSPQAATQVVVTDCGQPGSYPVGRPEIAECRWPAPRPSSPWRQAPGQQGVRAGRVWQSDRGEERRVFRVGARQGSPAWESVGSGPKVFRQQSRHFKIRSRRLLKSYQENLDLTLCTDRSPAASWGTPDAVIYVGPQRACPARSMIHLPIVAHGGKPPCGLIARARNPSRGP